MKSETRTTRRLPAPAIRLSPRTWLFALCLTTTAAAASADSAVVSYAKGNCFVLDSGEGHTLYERSGGGHPEVGTTVTGDLHDYGYKQLYDASGKELFVGYIQYWGVRDSETLESFKRDCR
jgi:hypothetical protein